MSAWYGVLIYMKIPLVVTIIPGNRNSGHPTEKLIFHLKLTLEAEEREGQFHRGIPTEGIVSFAFNQALFSRLINCQEKAPAGYPAGVWSLSY